MPSSIEEILARLREQVDEVTPDQVRTVVDADDGTLLLDVREADEVAVGMIPGAVHLPRGFLEVRAEKLFPDRNRRIIAYCGGGHRSLFAAEGLKRLGYENVESMVGGFTRWKNEGHPVHVQRLLGAEDRRRYSRHLVIPEVGEAGQQKLLDAKVLLIGAGGLGSPAAYYLAAAGVGTLGVVDDDVVDESNLQRQILHSTHRVGMAKVESARMTLRALNPGITVNAHPVRVDKHNVEELFAPYDIVLDGADNFPTRYLVNDACVLLRKPCVHGSVYRFEGQVTVFSPPAGPCYRCLFPEPPPADQAPSCAEAGVLGVLPGVVGLLEAVEVIKLILQTGSPLIGRLLHYDALAARFREFKIGRNPECRYCADGAEFPGFVDYDAFCSGAFGG